MDGQKKCRTCLMILSLSDFYKNLAMVNRVEKDCKKCKKIKVKANYAAKKPQYQAYEKTRASLPHRVEARAKYAQTEAGKKSIAQSKEKWLENNRVKRAAQTIYRNWKRYNKDSVPTNCSVCNSQKRIEAHHDDYSRPLSVRYLCRKCHYAWHALNGEGINGNINLT